MSDPQTDADINEAHREKMARRKAARDRVLATKTEERGLWRPRRNSVMQDAAK